MTSVNSTVTDTNLQQQANQALSAQQYDRAVILYEQAIEANPEIKSNYWFLGLAFLLQHEEEAAQATWLMGMADGSPNQIAQWTAELIDVLQTQADQCQIEADDATAWLIRQHIHAIDASNLKNLLHLVELATKLGRLTPENLVSWEVIAQLQEAETVVDEAFLNQTLKGVLAAIAPDPVVVDFVAACLPHIQNAPAFLAVLLPSAMSIAYSLREPELAAALLELYLQIEPNSIEVLGHLALFYQNASQYEKGIETAQRRLQLDSTLAEKVFSSHLLIRGLLSTGGHWQQAVTASQHHEQLLQALIEQQPSDLHIVHTMRLFNSCYYLPYFRDAPHHHRSLQNQVVQLCHRILQQSMPESLQRNQPKRSLPTKRRLKIGYLSHCMAQHSVGWLARWIFQHHDRDRFELYGYFINDRRGEPLFDWYVSQVEHAYIVRVDQSNSSTALAEKIQEDEIDILIELDSITLDLSCQVLALKPAPIQVTWLGWDASGLPTIDYFLADPYVLPDRAQTYYSEKVWRLPQSYIAVDGFEVGVPTLRREQLQIPADAVIYLSAQRGYKRHPEAAKLQLQILKAVPNSYFLVKGFADLAGVKQFFQTLAEEVGVCIDRIRFLPDVDSEATHRANLGIADVVLDTFPYNGATTTLETLWMGIPLVTQVGEQFAARNSYTMMINAGITEGIAFSSAEYVDWGIRFGTDAVLRQQVSWKLQQSRQTAPLWNGKQFTRNVEQAYEQMWTLYAKKQAS